MLKDMEKTEIYSDQSCKFKDGINCWLLYHLTIWDEFTVMIHRKDEVFRDTVNLADEYTSNFISVTRRAFSKSRK